MDPNIDLIVSLAMEAGEYGKELNRSVKDTKAWAGALKGAIVVGVAAAVAVIAVLVGAIIGIGAAAWGMSNETQRAMDMMQARTGAANEEMAEFKDIALDIYSSNLGASVTDVAEAMTTVKQITGETGDELQEITKDAIVFRDVFEKDIQESVRAVDTAVEVFGIGAGDVFDMLAGTIQRVGDPADDLLDTVNEYSTVFGQAGYSADEMLATLEAGLQAGARNFDVIADAVKEFSIRIIDGSATTEDALNDLFSAVGEGNEELADLKTALTETEAALEDNKAALEDAKGAYAASKQIVDDLSRALDTAKRELDDLSRPNLAGMQEFDDQLFELEQSSKQAKLAMLDMDPESDAYEAAEQQLDALNDEMDRVTLKRDIAFDRQLREIDKAAKEGTETVLTYDQAMAQIGQKKGEIAGLEDAWGLANEEMLAAEDQVKSLEHAQSGLTRSLADIKTSIEEADNPAKEFLKGFEDGSLTGKDAMGQIISKLKEVDDEVLRNQIGVALFGTKWEDLGEDIIFALDPAELAIQDVEGTLDAAGAAAQRGFGPFFQGLLRRAMVAIEPLGEKLMSVAEEYMPLVEQAFSWFETKLPAIIEVAGGWLDWLNEQIMTKVVPFITDTLIPAFQEWGDWLINEGWPAVQEFLAPILEQLIPGLELIGGVVMDLVSNAWPLLVAAMQWVGENFDWLWPIIATVGGVLLAISSPITAIIGAVILLATAWANNWGSIQEKTQAVLDFLAPYWEELKTIFNEFVTAVLPPLQEAWFALVDVWQNQLQPAVQDLWEAVGRLFDAFGGGEDKIDPLQIALGLLKTVLAGVVVVAEGLEPAIYLLAASFEFAIGGFEFAVDLLASMKRGFDNLLGLVERVKDDILDLGAALLDLIVPDIFMPGSPTPFELGLRGITSAIRMMPDIEIGANVVGAGLMTATPGAGFGAAAGGSRLSVDKLTVNVNEASTPEETAESVMDRIFEEAGAGV